MWLAALRNAVGFGANSRIEPIISKRDGNDRDDDVYRNRKEWQSEDEAENGARAHPRIVVSRLDVGPRRGAGWMPDDWSDMCLVCMAAFTFINRRHHCRQCLKLVCSACSSKKWQLDSGRGGRGPADCRVGFRRVCDECYAALVDAQEVLVGGEPSTLESGEYMHFEVVVHKIVPIDPFSTQPEMVADRREDGKAWSDVPFLISPGSAPSGPAGFPPSPSSISGAAPEVSPRPPGSECASRARARLCKLTVAGKEIGKTQLVEPTPYSIPDEVATDHHNFEQAFLFRVSCRTRVADYLILEVLNKPRVESHCRVPLFRTRRDRVQTFWHTLFKGNGAPGAVGRVLVTVRNLGAGSIARPVWGHSIPGGCPVPAPPEIIRQASSSEWRGAGERKSRWGGGDSPGSRDRVAPAAGEDLPDNPLLLKFFPRSNKMHDALFFRFGEIDADVLPFNERTLEILPQVRLRPILGQMGGNAGDSTRVRRGSPCGGEDIEDDEDSRMDGAESSSRSPSEDPWAVRAEAGSRGGTGPYASSSSAALFNSGFSPNSRDDPTSRHRKRTGRSSRACASSTVVDGALVLTTHRVLFFEDAGGGEAGVLVEIPLAFVLETAVRRELIKGQVGLKIRCRDKKVYPFVIMRAASRTAEAVLLQSVRKVEEEISWLAQEDNFAHSVDTCRADASLDPEGKSLELNLDLNSILNAPPSPFSRCTRGFPSEYHPAQEHIRQGIDESDQWRSSGVNRSFSLCQTYGRHLVVPSALGEQDIIKASKGRSRRRIPALTWLHPLTGAGLCRSSEPLAGFRLNPSLLDDEKLLNAIRATVDSPPDNPVCSGTVSTSGSKSFSSVAIDACADPGEASFGDHAEPSPTHEVLKRSRTGMRNSNEGPLESGAGSCDDQGVARAEARQEGGALQGNPIIVKTKHNIEVGGSYKTAGGAEKVVGVDEFRGKPRSGGSRDKGRGNEGYPVDIKSHQGILFLEHSSSSESDTRHLPTEATDASAEDTAKCDVIPKDSVSPRVSVGQSDLNAFPSDVSSRHPALTDGAEKRSPESCLGSMPTTTAGVTSAVDEERRFATASGVVGGARGEVSPNFVGGLVSPVTKTTLPVCPPVMDDLVLDVGDDEHDEAECVSSPSMTSISFPPEMLTLQSNYVCTTQRVSGSGVENAAAAGGTPSEPSFVSRMQANRRRVGSDVAEAAARPALLRSHSAPNLMEPRPGAEHTAVLRIMDARSVLSANAHRFLGKGHENIARLGGDGHASITFLDIPNAHAVQQNFNALVEACRTQEDNPARLVHMHGLRWVENISALLKGASRVCAYLEAGDPVLVHCSDGWDRTPQLTSLAQLLLDPYYRTFEGFQVLVDKDWCSFGHRFATRGGYGHNPNSRTSPIFLQFLDATYQLLRQFPISFEFSENLLLLLMHAFCSRWFNDFLHDSEYERVLAYARSSLAVDGGGFTVSLWSHVRHCRERYENVLWERPPGSFEGGDNSIGAGTSSTAQARNNFGYRKGVQSADAEMHSPRAELDLPPPLWPDWGVRSLVVWERAWAGKGWQHPVCGRPRNPIYNTEEALRELVQRLRSTIKDLRRRVEAGRGGGLDRGTIQC